MSKAEIFTYVAGHLDAVIAALPFFIRPAISRVAGGGYCDDEHRRTLDVTFRAKVKDLAGGEKSSP